MQACLRYRNQSQLYAAFVSQNAIAGSCLSISSLEDLERERFVDARFITCVAGAPNLERPAASSECSELIDNKSSFPLIDWRTVSTVAAGHVRSEQLALAPGYVELELDVAEHSFDAILRRRT